MPDTLTTNYSFTKIEEFGSVDTWGGKINDNMDDIDATVKAIDVALLAALALKVTGPAGAITADRIAVFDGTTGELVKQGTKTIADLDTLDAARIVGPGSAVADRIAVFDGTTGKLAKDGGKTIATLDADIAAKAAAVHTHAISDVTTLQTTLDTKSTIGLVDGINSQTGTAYTLVLTDAGKVVEMNNAAAQILTIPTNAVAAFPLRTIIAITRMGAGELSIAGAGVTIRSSGAKLRLSTQYSGASLYKRATDEWVLTGDIKT